MGKAAHESTRYDRDIYSWAMEQAALLRAGRIAEADALNIAEEIDDVATRQYDKLYTAVRLILLHFLKWDYWPERRCVHWRASINVQRHRVKRTLRNNDGLKPLIDEAVVDAYEAARIEAAVHTDLNDETFPLDCPYSWDHIMNRPIERPVE